MLSRWTSPRSMLVSGVSRLFVVVTRLRLIQLLLVSLACVSFNCCLRHSLASHLIVAYVSRLLLVAGFSRLRLICLASLAVHDRDGSVLPLSVSPLTSQLLFPWLLFTMTLNGLHSYGSASNTPFGQGGGTFKWDMTTLNKEGALCREDYPPPTVPDGCDNLPTMDTPYKPKIKPAVEKK
jgi:hypothetical protein